MIYVNHFCFDLIRAPEAVDITEENKMKSRIAKEESMQSKSFGDLSNPGAISSPYLCACVHNSPAVTIKQNKYLLTHQEAPQSFFPPTIMLLTFSLPHLYLVIFFVIVFALFDFNLHC